MISSRTSLWISPGIPIGFFFLIFVGFSWNSLKDFFVNSFGDSSRNPFSDLFRSYFGDSSRNFFLNFPQYLSRDSPSRISPGSGICSQIPLGIFPGTPSWILKKLLEGLLLELLQELLLILHERFFRGILQEFTLEYLEVFRQKFLDGFFRIFFYSSRKSFSAITVGILFRKLFQTLLYKFRIGFLLKFI